jgi:hypothetical protein
MKKGREVGRNELGAFLILNSGLMCLPGRYLVSVSGMEDIVFSSAFDLITGKSTGSTVIYVYRFHFCCQ